MFTQQADFAYAIFWSCVFVLSIIGAYALDQSMFDVWIALGAGILGFFMRMQWRHSLPPPHPAIRSGLIDLLKPLDPLVLKWGKNTQELSDTLT